MKDTPENRKNLEAEITKVRNKVSLELNELFFKVTGDSEFRKNIKYRR